MSERNRHKDFSSQSFLVTGGGGFIGSNLVDYLLEKGAGRVVALDNFSTGFHQNLEKASQSDSFELIEGDITNPETCQKAAEGVDVIFHQAALGSVPRSIRDPLSSNAVNVDGFLNMLCAARDHGVKRFVYASSSSVYGSIKTSPKQEEKTGKPLSPYAVTKVVNELYAEVFSNIYGLKIIGLRYFNVFGPKQNPNGPYAAVIPIFIRKLLSGERPVVYGDGEQTRDFTYIDNVVQANIKAAFSEKPDALNKVYNIAAGHSTSLNELISILKKKIGSDVGVEYQPPRAGDIKDSLADISQAKQYLGYEPEIFLEEGLEKTIQFFKNSILHEK